MLHTYQTLASNSTSSPSKPSSSSSPTLVSLQLFPYVDNSLYASFKFSPIETLVERQTLLTIGRKVDKLRHPQWAANYTPESAHELDILHHDFIAFRSKVVSRFHAELWIDKEGQVYLKDIGSSSGSFLNRLRLSPSGKKSGLKLVKNGDIIQLGVDYQGRQEEIYKCVVMKIFITNRVSERPIKHPQAISRALTSLLSAMSYPTDPQESTACTECCICLSVLSPYQALFLAPCSHCFHYKCVIPLLSSNVMFQCPLCRQVANLDSLARGEQFEEVLKRVEMDRKEESTSSDDPPAQDPRPPASVDVESEGPSGENEAAARSTSLPSPLRIPFNRHDPGVESMSPNTPMNLYLNEQHPLFTRHSEQEPTSPVPGEQDEFVDSVDIMEPGEPGEEESHEARDEARASAMNHEDMRTSAINEDIPSSTNAANNQDIPSSALNNEDMSAFNNQDISASNEAISTIPTNSTDNIPHPIHASSSSSLSDSLVDADTLEMGLKLKSLALHHPEFKDILLQLKSKMNADIMDIKTLLNTIE